MRYTFQSGIDRSAWDRFLDNARYILPLLAILILAIYLGISHAGSDRPNGKPLTLGIYTIKSNDGSKSNGAAKPNDQNSNSTASGGSAPNLSQISSSPAVLNTNNPSLVSSGNGVAPSGSPSTPPPVGGMGSGPSTFPCVDASTGLSITCTYQVCTPPVALIGSQKAFIATSGTCVVVN